MLLTFFSFSTQSTEIRSQGLGGHTVELPPARSSWRMVGARTKGRQRKLLVEMQTWEHGPERVAKTHSRRQ